MTANVDRRSAVRLLAGAAATFGSSSHADDRPTRLIVPYPPGGPLDVVARALAESARGRLGTIVVDNKPGAGGNIGADACAKAPPDGRTLVMGAVATHAINPWLYRHMPYDPIRDFTPLIGVARVPNVLVMERGNAVKLGIRSVGDLVAYARRHPGTLNYGSGGNGSAGHLAGEIFGMQAGVSIVHIPYAGGSAAQLALLSGQVDLDFDNLAAASVNVRAGKLIALAVTTGKRSSEMPEVPTIASSGGGLTGFDVDTWFGLFGPSHLPEDIARRLIDGFEAALATPALKLRLAALMADPLDFRSTEFGAFVARELARYQSVVKASGASIE